MSLSIRVNEKAFGKGSFKTSVLQDVNLTVENGEFLTVIGPSGCGKSTLLKIAAGLDGDYEGRISMNGREIKGPGIQQGFIFQEHRLFPWMTVEQNIAADLSLKEPAVRKKVDELIETVRLKGAEKQYPREPVRRNVAAGRDCQGFAQGA